MSAVRPLCTTAADGRDTTRLLRVGYNRVPTKQAAVVDLSTFVVHRIRGEERSSLLFYFPPRSALNILPGFLESIAYLIVLTQSDRLSRRLCDYALYQI